MERKRRGRRERESKKRGRESRKRGREPVPKNIYMAIKNISKMVLKVVLHVHCKHFENASKVLF